MTQVIAVKCEWCDSLTRHPQSTDSKSSLLRLEIYPKVGKVLDFCDRDCLAEFLSANPKIGV